MSTITYDWNPTGEPAKTLARHRAETLAIAESALRRARSTHRRRDLSSGRTIELLEHWVDGLRTSAEVTT